MTPTLAVAKLLDMTIAKPVSRRAAQLGVALAAVAWGLAGVTAMAQDRHGKPPQGVNLAPLYQLATHRGGRLDPQSLRRRPFAVVFGFTHCPDICPTTLLHLKTLLDEIGPAAKSFPVLFVTVDPDRDTAAVLAPYVASIDERIIGLTGAAIEIEAVSHAFNAFYEKRASTGSGYSVDHTIRVYVMDAFGLLADVHDPAKEAGQLKNTLAKVLRQ